MSEHDLPEHILENRRHWDAVAAQWGAEGERGFGDREPTWGCWGHPEAELQLLPTDMSGMHAIDLGCGTGHVASWLALRGAHAVGIDTSLQQLNTAQKSAEKHRLELTLVHGSAEQVPYPDQSFDYAVSEYGAVTWCDPRVWIPEAHRLLKPGGGLAFLGNSPLSMVCTPRSGAPCEPVLHRSYFDLQRLDWRGVEVDPGGISFHLTISQWLRLFRDTGFEVLDYHELQAPEGAADRYGVPGSWAQRWPAEHAWKLRRM